MRSIFSTTWKKSMQARKQRKFRFNAPLHSLHKFMAAPLAKDLRVKYLRRSLELRKGDKVKIMRGKFKGKVGKIETVSYKHESVFVHGAETIKKDGSKSYVPVHPSNIMILEPLLDDKKRMKKNSVHEAKKNG